LRARGAKAGEGPGERGKIRRDENLFIKVLNEAK
jgi:hypothetical protein